MTLSCFGIQESFKAEQGIKTASYLFVGVCANHKDFLQR